MGKDIFVVNKTQIMKMRNDLQACIDKCDDIMKKSYKIIDETAKTYSTPSGEYFRTSANDFILEYQKFVEKDVAIYIKKLDDIIKLYDDMNEDIFNSINGGN